MLRRRPTYIGVLIDDLVTKGVGGEPYRMLVASGHRLLLREDNADRRLMPIAREMDIIDNDSWRRFEEKLSASKRSKWSRKSRSHQPLRYALEWRAQSQPAKARASVEQLGCPEMTWDMIEAIIDDEFRKACAAAKEQVLTDIKYTGICDESSASPASKRLAALRIPRDMSSACLECPVRSQRSLNVFSPITLLLQLFLVLLPQRLIFLPFICQNISGLLSKT